MGTGISLPRRASGVELSNEAVELQGDIAAAYIRYLLPFPAIPWITSDVLFVGRVNLEGQRGESINDWIWPVLGVDFQEIQ